MVPTLKFYVVIFFFQSMILSHDDLLNRYVGNVNPNVTESLLIEVFQSAGLVERCKLIRKEKVNFCSQCLRFGVQVISHQKLLY